uniref:small monomeric GTPase n=1 Tax=Varanus komodoensis TaxID=61221 RepID=A0A8D2J408_VARKO
MSSPQGGGHQKQLRWADGFVIVYSICDRASFQFAHQQLLRIQQLKRRGGAEKLPVILVGNKRDLQHRRAVSSEEGRLLALSTNAGFFEISAAETYHGALVVFHELLDLVRDSRSSIKKASVGIRGIVRSMSRDGPAPVVAQVEAGTSLGGRRWMWGTRSCRFGKEALLGRKRCHVVVEAFGALQGVEN